MTDSSTIIKELFVQLELDGITLSDDLIESVNNRDGKALCCVGLIYLSKHEYTKSIPWQRLSASTHFSKGQFCLGMAYRKGQGVPLDHHISLEWLLKAAYNNDFDAFHYVGESLEQGFGVPVNKKMALEWYHKVNRSSQDINRLNNQGYYITRADQEKPLSDLIRETKLILNIEKQKIETKNKLKNIIEDKQTMKNEIELLKQTNISIEEELRNIKEKMILLENNNNNKLSNSSEQANKMIELLHQANEKIIQLSEKSKQDTDKKMRNLKKENKNMKQKIDRIEKVLQRSNEASDDELRGTGFKRVGPENDEV